MPDTAPLAPAHTAPVRYDPALEVAEEGEAETTAGLIDSLHKIAEKTFADSGHALRGVHAKSHGLVRGELRVLPGLPPELKQGLFTSTSTHPVAMRFSTSPGDILDDKVSTPRGLAIKVMNVEGARLPGSEGDTTQDFLLVDAPAFGVPTAKKFAGNLKLLAATTDRADGLKKVLSAVLQGTERALEAFGGKSGTLISLGGHAPTHVLGATYFTTVPMLYGEHMAKLSIAPVSPGLVALTQAKVDLDGKPNGLREALAAHIARDGGEWEVRIQLCTDLEKMPIEDPSVEWTQELSPYVAVARIVAPPQDAIAADDSEFGDDRIAFSPWHGIAAHRPIGSIMRVRKAVYEASIDFRATANRCPIHEPRAM